MLRKILFILLLVFLAQHSFSQMGGSATYEFLNLPSSTRIATMGGNNVSNYDNDLNFSLTNPALLRHTMDKQVSLNYINYVSDINLGYVTYAHDIKDVGTFAAGLHYINYGDFLHTNETGEILGNFVPSEYSLNLYYSRPLNSKFNAGAALKTIYSSFFTHFSSGVALDLGLSYFDSDHLFSAGLVVKNFGSQLKPYTPDNYEPLPFDVQLGFTKGLSHAPLRFSVTFQNLLNWNLSYKSVFESSNMMGEDVVEEDKFINKVEDYADELMRHVILGFEIVPGDSFFISLGYNYRRRSELSLSTMPKLVGMSIGAGLRLEKFNFSYGIASYHLAGNSNHITLGLNLGAFYKKLN